MKKQKKKSSIYQPDCPRCSRKELRANNILSTIRCRACGYSGPWREFFQGTEQRKKVQKLFDEGILEGKEIPPATK